MKWISLVVALVLVGCATKPEQQATTVPTTTAKGGASSSQGGGASGGHLTAPSSPRSWNEARLQAARRIVAASPDQTFQGKPPDMLLAIPVLSVELNADGSIRNIDVMRKPSQALDTIEIAKAAIRRAAPFGDVSRLPKPWKFNETFLFNDQRKFKPMTLDQR